MMEKANASLQNPSNMIQIDGRWTVPATTPEGLPTGDYIWTAELSQTTDPRLNVVHANTLMGMLLSPSKTITEIYALVISGPKWRKTVTLFQKSATDSRILSNLKKTLRAREKWGFVRAHLSEP